MAHFFEETTKVKIFLRLSHYIPPIVEILCVKNVGHLWFVVFLKNPEKNRGSRLGVTCYLNPAQFECKWAGLDVLF